VPIVPIVPRADHHGMAGLGRQVPAIGVPPVLRCTLLVIGRQARDAHHLRLQAFRAGGVALAVADGMYPAAVGHAFASGRLGLSGHGHRHDLPGWDHHEDSLLLEPPQIAPIPAPLVEDDLVQAGMAGQGGACLRDQGPQGERCLRLERPHRRRPGELGAGLDPHAQLKALDGALDRMHLAPRVGDPALTGHLSTAVRL
jgi:hypothetical protein